MSLNPIVLCSPIKAIKFISGITIIVILRLKSLSSPFIKRNLAKKCIKRWAKKTKAGNNSRKLVKYNSTRNKSKTSSKGMKRTINILSIARRRVFLKRWYNYTSSKIEWKGHWKKVITYDAPTTFSNNINVTQVNRFYARKVKRLFLRRLHQQAAYNNTVTTIVRNYFKYDHAILLVSHCIRAFRKYVSERKKKRSGCNNKISDMKFYYYSVVLSSLGTFINKKQKYNYTHTVLLTNNNTSKLRKCMQIWKKRRRRHYLSRTKTNKAVIRRRRLLCPKYIQQWVAYLSSKLNKHRQYFKVIQLQ